MLADKIKYKIYIVFMQYTVCTEDTHQKARQSHRNDPSDHQLNALGYLIKLTVRLTPPTSKKKDASTVYCTSVYVYINCVPIQISLV
jgi:hypothetical protein